MSALVVLISISSVVVISYLFRIIAKRTSIPSVLFLVVFGILVSQVLSFFNMSVPYSQEILEVLGLGGLVIIVLEGALDLTISRKKLPLIFKAFATALLILIASTFAIGALLHVVLNEPLYVSLVYAIPMSVISSAIVIASINALPKEKREFAIYEATFSDIIGIMFFEYFLMKVPEGSSYVAAIGTNILLTIVVSLIIALLLLYLFQYLEQQSNVKFFLFISILALLFAIGKMLHISSLLLVFMFGIILKNYNIIEKLRLARFFNKEIMQRINHDFHFIILETAFLIGTFFFLLFGMNINVLEWWDIKVVVLGVLITAAIYLVRFVFLKLFNWKQPISLNELFLAPRGLITVILFYKIPDEYQLHSFNTGVISLVMILTIILMAYGIKKSQNKINEDLLEEDIDEILHEGDNEIALDSDDN